MQTRRRLGVGLLVTFAMSYAPLSCLLPGDAPAPAGAKATVASSVTATGEEQHGELGHTCGLEAKAMLKRFQEAIERRGAVHATYDYRAGSDVGVLAVRGQVNVGLAGDRPGAAEALAARHGLSLLRVLPGMAVLGCPGDEKAALVALAGDPAVRWAEPNYGARVALTPNDPFQPLLKGHRGAGLEQAWDVTTGDPQVIVAVLDTGVDPDHPDLRTRLEPGYDFVNQTAILTDDNGHGTAMAGIIGAEGNNAEGIAGVSFGARVLPVKVADAMGVASVADVAAGIDFAIQRGARVINLSMGTPVGSQALLDAVNRALTAGIVVVASAGNDPVHHEMFPAAYPGVISATVVSDRGELGYEAVLAEGVDVGAPAEDVLTTLPGDVYGFVGGSSSAAAFASGVAALVISRDRLLTGAQAAQVLRSNQDPIAALVPYEGIYRFGRLNPQRAVEQTVRGRPDLAVTAFRLLPRKPLPGQAGVAIVEVSNEGLVDVTNVPVRVARTDAAGTTVDVSGTTISLTVGERRELRIPFTAPAAGTFTFVAELGAIPTQVDVADDRRTKVVDVSAATEVDVRVIARSLTTPDLATGSVTATVTVENQGTQATAAFAVTARVQEIVASSSPAAPVTVLTPVAVPSLAVGARTTVQFTWTVPATAPRGVVRLLARADALTGETRLDDNSLTLDFLLGSQGPLNALYQQSNGVDLIPDAPWRIEPNRAYVPVQIFVPSKGGRTPATKLDLTRTEIRVRDVAAGTGGTLVYDDPGNARPTVAPPGLEIVDEVGAPRTGVTALDVFGDVELDMNGRHDILRLPRSALGVPAAPTTLGQKFVDVKVTWAQRRAVFFGLTITRTGSHRAVMRVRFPTAGMPTVPGENHYHDVHHHTIAEWYFGSPLDLFAPRKAYGGPMQMVFESAYVMGLIQAPTKQAAWGKLITTDHSSFNNRTIPDPDGPDHRPPFGPQSASLNPGVGQLEAYRNLLGPSAGEEIAFKQDIPIPRINIPYVNQLANFLPGIPMGAHMLLYHSSHVEGPWHGGGWLRGPGNPNIDVNLFPLLNDVAKNRTAEERAFIYAAHPFSGMGWNDGNLDKGYGLDPAQRTRDEVHDTTGEFVVKGLEFFNGRGTRSLPTAQIDFNDLNPWSDATFSAGVRGWDKGVWHGMTEWHRFLAKTLEYSFITDPETRFIRKIYQAGGSDAHGDFNFSVGRAATPIGLQQTYNVGDEAWYAVRTYCFGDGKPGATPEDRWMAAYSDGNCVTTDGPLLTLALDADRKFDSAKLQWHDTVQSAENADGKIGGEGPLDGGYTALVRRGADAPGFRYRYSTTDEWGPIHTIHLYKTEAGAPNPTRTRGSIEQIVGLNRLALGGADLDLTQALDVAKEGPVTKPTAFAAGAFTGGDPDVTELGPDDYRCYTNPVFAVPYDVDVTVASIDSTTGTIPAGALQVRWTFDISMDPSSSHVEVKGLDANGNSTDLMGASLTRLIPTAGSGWSDRPGIKSSVLTLTNQGPIALGGAEYPRAGRATFVVFWRDAPRDAAGNSLNPIATTFETQYVGGRGTTAAPITNGSPIRNAGGGGGGGGGGCAIATGSETSRPWTAFALLIGLFALAVSRRRMRTG